ncbi:hypothetical protein NBB33_23660, partial [Salmonella sp. NW1189]
PVSSGLGWINGDAPPVKHLAIHCVDGVPHRLLIVEGHEAESTGSTGFPITYNLGFHDFAIGAESLLQASVVSRPCKTSNEASELNIC